MSSIIAALLSSQAFCASTDIAGTFVIDANSTAVVDSGTTVNMSDGLVQVLGNLDVQGAITGTGTVETQIEFAAYDDQSKVSQANPLDIADAVYLEPKASSIEGEENISGPSVSASNVIGEAVLNTTNDKSVLVLVGDAIDSDNFTLQGTNGESAALEVNENFANRTNEEFIGTSRGLDIKGNVALSGNNSNLANGSVNLVSAKVSIESDEAIPQAAMSVDKDSVLTINSAGVVAKNDIMVKGAFVVPASMKFTISNSKTFTFGFVPIGNPYDTPDVMEYDVSTWDSKITDPESDGVYTDGVFTYTKDGEKFVRRAQIKFPQHVSSMVDKTKTTGLAGHVYTTVSLDKQYYLYIYDVTNARVYENVTDDTGFSTVLEIGSVADVDLSDKHIIRGATKIVDLSTDQSKLAEGSEAIGWYINENDLPSDSATKIKEVLNYFNTEPETWLEVNSIST